MDMVYIGNDSSTILTGTIMTLNSIQRTDKLNYFPSGIMLSFKYQEKNGKKGLFGMSDSKQWRRLSKMNKSIK